jgi:hypothetical protein
MQNELVVVTATEISGRAVRDGLAITVELRGSADHPSAYEAIGKLLAEVQVDAKRETPREVAVEMRELEFMNSSCFKLFVNWISNIQALDEDHQYKVRFVANPDMHWQRRSLDALRCFAVELITVDGIRPR